MPKYTEIFEYEFIKTNIPYKCDMGLLPDTQNCGLRMRQECRERFPRQRVQRKPRVSDPDMHHGTCLTHVPWCMSGSLTRGGGVNVPGIPGACATRNFAYLVRGPYHICKECWFLWIHIQIFPCILAFGCAVCPYAQTNTIRHEKHDDELCISTFHSSLSICISECTVCGHYPGPLRDQVMHWHNPSAKCV